MPLVSEISYPSEVWSVPGKQPTTCVTLQEAWWCHHISCEGTDAVWAHSRPAFLPVHTAPAGRVGITEMLLRMAALKAGLGLGTWGWRNEKEEVNLEPSDHWAKRGGSQRNITSHLHDAAQGARSPRCKPSIWDHLSPFSCWAVLLLRGKPWLIAALHYAMSSAVILPRLPLPLKLLTSKKLY